jgi:peptidoglycan/LPS O-acetylase OafA/YrhL
LFVEFLYNGTKISEEFISTFPLWHLATFFVGMVAARLIALKTFVEFFSAYAAWGLSLSFAVFIYLIYLPNPILKYVHNGLLSPVFALLIISLYYDRTIVNKTLSHPRLSKLGDFSYGLFIFQYPVWVVCSKLAKAEFLLSTWFFLIYLIVLFVLAWLVNFYFEKPLLKIIRQRASSDV